MDNRMSLADSTMPAAMTPPAFTSSLARDQQSQARRDLSLQAATLLLESASRAASRARDFEHWLDTLYEALEAAREYVAHCLEHEDAQWIEELVAEAPHLDRPLQHLHAQGSRLCLTLESLTERVADLYGIVRLKGLNPQQANAAMERVSARIDSVIQGLHRYEQDLSSFLMDAYFCDLGCGD